MSFWFFTKKRDDELDGLNKRLEDSFSNIKKDMGSVSKWINHLEDHRKEHHSKIIHAHSRVDEIEKRLNLLEGMFSELKNKQSFVISEAVSKHKQTDVRLKQTSVGVQTPVQTAVQTPVQEDLNQILRGLTTMERALVWVLLNTDLKVTYEDLAVMLDKDKSTIRGQLNNIKRKSETLVSEIVQKDGKKRFYIGEELKESIKKMVVKRSINAKKEEK